MNIDSLFVILFFLSLGLAAFFCSAETAFIGMQKLRLQHLIQSGHPAAKKVAKIMEQPEKFLATVLLGVNFFETAVATIGTVLAVSLWGEKLGAAIATILITVITLIFAELVPKSLGARYGEKLALRYIKFLEFTSMVLYPVVYALNHIGIRLTNLVGEDDEHRPTLSEEEFRTAISVGEKEGVVKEAEAEMLHKVFEFGGIPARKIMVPRPKIVALERNAKLADFLALYLQSPYSRFPMYEDSIDNIVGILSIRDVLVAQAQGSLTSESPLGELTRPAYFVPETKLVGELLPEMQSQGYHLAIVIDEFGGTAGIITMEQLAEEIVGELKDELAKPTRDFEAIDEHNFQIEGSTRVEDINEQLDLKLPLGEYETIAGFLLHLLGHIPQEGEQIKYLGLKFTVTGMKERRIEKILVTREQKADAAATP